MSAAERAAITPGPAPLPLSHLYAAVVASLFALSWVPVLIRRAVRARKARSKASPKTAPPRLATLHRLSVGFDWTVREALQSEIDALARTLSLDGDSERADAARAVASCLRAHLSGARYAVTTVEQVPLREAPGALDRIATDLRARFAHETRGARPTAEAGELEARPEEGPGLLVVSLVTGGTLDATATAIEDRADLERTLDALRKPYRLDGLEVVWSPAEPDDRMSSFELERFYPELRRLAEAGAVGAIACPHCGAPRPAELAACPRCGSPATT